MAFYHTLVFFSFLVLSTFIITNSQETTPYLALDPAEQESVYRVLDSVNPTIPWRSIYPDDLCASAPHGVVCDYFSDSDSEDTNATATANDSVHITELSFGFVSDNSPNPPCYPNSTLSPLVFTSFKYLRKLFFYQCFNDTLLVSPPSLETTMSFADTIEELVFVDNPSFIGPLSGILRNFPSLRRVILSGTGLSGSMPEALASSANLEELTLSRNKLAGEYPPPLLSELGELKILDLSYNNFSGNIPDSVSQNLPKLLKLDLSYNGFSGKIPESLEDLKSLEFLDLSFNAFGGFGIPTSISRMAKLKEVYLSGNQLGGVIPDAWQNPRGLVRIGFSDMGLIGKIPGSMGVYLQNLSYLGLENNNLEGPVPMEFGLLGSLSEINLENNSLSGRVSFNNDDKPGFGLIKLSGNPNLCVDQALWASKNGSSGFGQVKICEKLTQSQRPTPVPLNGRLSSSSLSAQVLPSTVVVFVGLLLFFLIMLSF